jgi:hypothetical protein
MSQRETLSVVRIESFYFDCDLFRLGQQGDTSIGHRPIDVHKKHLNLRGPLFEGSGDSGRIRQEASIAAFVSSHGCINLPDLQGVVALGHLSLDPG